MGKLVRMSKYRRPASARPRQKGEAEIVIFTGIRYERGSQPVTTEHGGGNRRRRKRG
jgi:hypothetical protein